MKQIKRFLACFPTALPRGLSEFEPWAKSIIDIYSLPDNDSVRFGLATMIMHVKPQDAYKSKRYFGLTALKGASSQVAHQVMQDLKEAQAARIKAEQEAAAAAATIEAAQASNA